MAFNTNNGAAAQSRGPQAAEDNPAWKAAGFINIYLPTKDGGRMKLGAIKLRANNVREKQLSDWMNETGEDGANLHTLINKLQFEYNNAEGGEGRELDLPGFGV